MDIQELCSPSPCGVVGVWYCGIYIYVNMYVYIYMFAISVRGGDCIYLCIYIYICIFKYAYVYMVAGRKVFSQKCAKFVDRWGPAT